MSDTDPVFPAALSNYRHRKILERLFQRKSVSADELTQEFGVSKITIRRDLDALASGKFLVRTRGGAVAVSSPKLESLFDEKDHLAKREKSRIGEYVATLVAENETVFINAGSTTLEVIRHLVGKKLRVVTNNAACLSLDLDPKMELILLGGEYRPFSRSLVGEMTIGGTEHIFASLTILGINGVSLKGFTTAVQQETSVNKAMIENTSGKVIVVADHTKMNSVSSFLTCPLSRIDLLITDWLAPEAFCSELESAGLRVVRVPEEAE